MRPRPHNYCVTVALDGEQGELLRREYTRQFPVGSPASPVAPLFSLRAIFSLSRGVFSGVGASRHVTPRRVVNALTTFLARDFKRPRRGFLT